MFVKAEKAWSGEADHVYQDLDQIRLVWENGKLVGWYRPGEEE